MPYDTPRHASPRRWTLSRWSLVGGAAVGAAVLVVAALRGGTEKACAAVVQPPKPGATYRGSAEFYEQQTRSGNCSFGTPPRDDLYAGVSAAEYADSAACGSYLDVTGPRGTVRVLVIDQCSACGRGRVDLSKTAFARVADPVQGSARVAYRAVPNPQLPGSLSFRAKSGSTDDWLAFLPINTGNPVARLDVRSTTGPASAGWRRMTRGADNYWAAGGGVGGGPYMIRITDNLEHQAVVSGIVISSARLQRTTVWMYDSSAAEAPPAPSSKFHTTATDCH